MYESYSVLILGMHTLKTHSAELDCLDNKRKLYPKIQARSDTTYIFSRTMPLAWEEPAKGFFHSFPKWLFLYDLSAQSWALQWFLSFRPAPIPRVLLQKQMWFRQYL
jgi:hypothetical protein